MNSVQTLILSPHFDDVAFSLGGAILSGFFPRPIEYVNFFTVTRHAVFYQGVRDSAHITPIRKLEDDEFAGRLDLGHFNLGLVDASIRKGEPSESIPFLTLSSLLIDNPKSRVKIPSRLRQPFIKRKSVTSVLLRRVARIGGAYSAVRGRIQSLISVNPDVTLVAPLGLGNHPDHVLVSCAFRSFEGQARRVFYYEDLPYAISYSLLELEKQVFHLDRRLHPRLVDVEPFLERKLANLSVYKSQVTDSEKRAVTKHARRIVKAGAAERMWTY